MAIRIRTFFATRNFGRETDALQVFEATSDIFGRFCALILD